MHLYWVISVIPAYKIDQLTDAYAIAKRQMLMNTDDYTFAACALYELEKKCKELREKLDDTHKSAQGSLLVKLQSS
jgi:hypothetical protein